MPAPTRTARRPRRSPAAAEPEADLDTQTDEDERPAPRRGSSRPGRRAAPEAKFRSAKTDDDDEGGDDDDAPRSGKDNGLSGGWGSWKQRQQESSSFADDFKVEYKTRYLVLFLDAAPFVAFNEHWIDEMPQGQKKSWVCIGKGCPLCDAIGEKPKAKAMFNVLEFIETDDGWEPVLKVWTVGSGVANVLEDRHDEYSEDEGTGLERNYWKVSKVKKGSGRGGSTDYNVDFVDERDLEEKWKLEPLTTEQIEEWVEKGYDASYVVKPTKKKLQEIVEEVLEED